MYFTGILKTIYKTLFIATALLKETTQASINTFMSIGDWGGASIDLDHARWENTVAKTFSDMASKIKPSFIVGTGDNFYYYGVKNSSDPLFTSDFENVYNHSSLMVPWYQTLGNHDYGMNVDAQLEYKSIYNRWIMPSRYYTKRIQLDKNNYATFIFLDTSPCVQDYRNDDPINWDPCSTNYPGPKDCKFHENILSQKCEDQYAWLKNKTSNISKNDWIIGVGHHPAGEIDVSDLTALLKKANIHLYLNGHAHELRQYSVDNIGTWITTGAGSMVSTDEIIKDKSLHKSYHNSYINDVFEHDIKSVWNKKVAGFTTHTFTNNYKVLVTNFVDYKGNTIHTTKSYKD